MRTLLLTAVASCLVVPSVWAQELRPVLSPDSAQAIIEGCKVFATQNGRSHAIAVHDSGANLVAFVRMAGNGPGIGAFSIEKSKAVAMWGFATSGMEEAIKTVPGFANAPGVVTVPGGIPIFTEDGKHFLGAAAASGEAPQDDAACAQAGIRAAGLSVERVRR